MMTNVMNAVEHAFAKHARTKHNPNTALNSRLPPEILARIARHSSLAVREMCLYVCSYWRQALLAERSLWTVLSLMYGRDDQGGLDHFAGMLRRGLLGPNDATRLDLTVYMIPAAPIDMLSVTIQGVLTHLRTMRACSSTLLSKDWRPVLSSPAPNLETLVLAQSPGPPGQNGRLTPLPDDLFAGIAPKLTEVDLTHIGIPLAADADIDSSSAPGALQALANVTRLAYTVQSTMFAEIARAFRACPRIESLRIRADRADLTSPGPAFVVPPSFRSMSIRGHVAPGVTSPFSIYSGQPPVSNSLYIHSPLPGGRDATLSGVANLSSLSVLPMRYRERGMIGASDFVDVVACGGTRLVAYDPESSVRPGSSVASSTSSSAIPSRATSPTPVVQNEATSVEAEPSLLVTAEPAEPVEDYAGTIDAEHLAPPAPIVAASETDAATSSGHLDDSDGADPSTPRSNRSPGSPASSRPGSPADSPPRRPLFHGHPSVILMPRAALDAPAGPDSRFFIEADAYTSTRGALGVYAREMVLCLEQHVDFFADLRELRIADYILATLARDVLLPCQNQPGQGQAADPPPFRNLRVLEIHLEHGLRKSELATHEFPAWWRRMFVGSMDEEELFVDVYPLPKTSTVTFLEPLPAPLDDLVLPVGTLVPDSTPTAEPATNPALSQDTTPADGASAPADVAPPQDQAEPTAEAAQTSAGPTNLAAPSTTDSPPPPTASDLPMPALPTSDKPSLPSFRELFSRHLADNVVGDSTAEPDTSADPMQPLAPITLPPLSSLFIEGSDSPPPTLVDDITPPVSRPGAEQEPHAEMDSEPGLNHISVHSSSNYAPSDASWIHLSAGQASTSQVSSVSELDSSANTVGTPPPTEEDASSQPDDKNDQLASPVEDGSTTEIPRPPLLPSNSMSSTSSSAGAWSARRQHRPTLTFPSLRTVRLAADPSRETVTLRAEHVAAWLPRSVQWVDLFNVALDEEACELAKVQVRRDLLAKTAARGDAHWPWVRGIGVEIKRWGWEFDVSGSWQV
ncbi:hypothetical protein BKA62DRAFT_682454 [Auriculariales sp. MPI-PUGE-AT-0066]|nr:hypothetical protein BKA62DRAFT_682454 [Auriculariales sp. MPI-PUGE-AT-0066]